MVLYRYLDLILLQTLHLAKIGCLLALVSCIYNFEMQVKFRLNR